MVEYSVNIDNRKYTNAVFPLKYGEHLDEQLDSAMLTLTRVNKPYFKPSTPVIITIKSNNTINGGVYQQQKTLEYVISADNAVESPIGSGEYRHTLSLIEPTKLLEIPIETLCFTNTSPKIFTKTQSEFFAAKGYTSELIIKDDYPVQTPLNVGETFTIKPFNEVFAGTISSSYQLVDENNSFVSFSNSQGIQTFYLNAVGKFRDENSILSQIDPPIVSIAPGVNIVRYNIALIKTGTIPGTAYKDFTFSVAGISSKNPLIPWNLKSVIDRILDVHTPLLKGEKRRFNLELPQEKGRRELFERYDCPEFTFTKCTLREALQIIGGYIHAEPRLKYNNATNEFDTIVFDFYDSTEYATFFSTKDKITKRLSDYNYENITNSWNLDQGCTELDAYVQNLTNRLKENQGATVGQPFINGYQTFRTETAYVALSEDNMYFPTAYPVSQIVSFKYFDGNNTHDLTPYVYEKTIYDTQLSSYETTYPVSKAYGLYYTLNEKGIHGFFFKNAEITGGALANYAIVNIIKAVTGTTISGLENYTNMRFQLEYVPIYSARIAHSKSYLTDFLPYPRQVNYSQGDNQVEAEYFGENIKGAVERLGTLEKLITFTCFNLNTIPKKGQLWDDEYSIATISVEVMHNKFKVTLGLSRHFNRLSPYVGVNSYKRIYEVSERMVQERSVLWKEYAIFTDYNSQFGGNVELSLIKQAFFQAICAELTNNDSYAEDKRIVAMSLTGYTQKDEALNRVFLPVVTSAEGNVINFSCEYQDNFSAGKKVIDYSSNDRSYVTEVEYADYYGRMYYLSWYLSSISKNDGYGKGLSGKALPMLEDSTEGTVSNIDNATKVFSTSSGKPQLIRKDGREKLQIGVSIQFLAESNAYVIGSGLAQNNSLVTGKACKPKLVVLNRRLGRFDKIISDDDIIATFSIPSANMAVGNTYASLAPITGKIEQNGKAWAIITERQENAEITYENEAGEEITVKSTSGGELLIGKNEDIPQGDNVEVCSGFTVYTYHDIYKLIKEKQI